MKNKKLVSRNPVLRFQNGKKIVKALLGTIIDYTTRYLNPFGSTAAAYDIIHSNDYTREIYDNAGEAIRKPIRSLYYGYDPDKRAISEGAKRTANGYVIANTITNAKKKKLAANAVANKKRLVDSQRRLAAITDPSLLPRNWYIDPKDGAVYLHNSDGGRTLIGKPNFRTPVNNGTPAAPAGNGRISTTTTTSTIGNGIGNTPTYYATRAYRNRIPVSKLNSRDAVRKFQEQIGMTGRDLDGIWGDRTQAAYERWKNNLKLLASTAVSPNTSVSPITNFSVEEAIGNGLLSPSVNNWSAKAKSLKNLEYTLNPIFTNQTLSAKKGGQLTSKNPVERFKQTRNFI